MVNQIRTLEFLPEIFRTSTNEQFLSSTLDVLVSQPDLKRTEGFIGNKWGYGVVGSDRYVAEPSKTRSDYQLEPSVVFLQKDTTTATDFIDYPGIIQAIKNAGAPTEQQNNLFSNQFYSWDSFTSLDMVVNFRSYWWIPLGPDAIPIPGAVNVLDIIGRPNYTANMGSDVDPLTFINGLKIIFSADATPASYRQGAYYVEGVGTSIQLVPADLLTCTEVTSGLIYIPWNSDPWDTTVWSEQLFVPIYPDYIVMARNSGDYNAWSRGNRWFHQSVLDATIKYTGQVTANPQNTVTRAQRPILQFYPNLNLYNSGTSSSGTVDYLDNYTADALSTVSGQANPQVTRWYATATATDASGSITLNTIVGLEVNQQINFLDRPDQSDAAFGGLSKGTDYYIDTLDASSRKITLRLQNGVKVTTTAAVGNLAVTSSREIVITDTTIIFSRDNDSTVRAKIWNLTLEPIGAGGSTVAVLSPEAGVTVVSGSQSNIRWGIGDYSGTTWRWNGTSWVECQKKTNLNQPPLFDVYNSSGVSFSDPATYPATTFTGCTLFRYKPATGTNDPVLGYPIAYSSISDLGDILFEVTYNSDVWSWTKDGQTTAELVSNGYVHQREGPSIRKLIGWVTAAAPSRQYQVFAQRIEVPDTLSIVCDIPALPESRTIWQPVQVYRQGNYLDTVDYTVEVDTTAGTTTITFTSLLAVGESVGILILSDLVSKTAFWSTPANLQNNPFNQQITQIAEGDIRNHWSTIFTNIPGAQGQMLGNNNLNNLSNINAYGTSVIQSSAPLVLPGVFLRRPDLNLITSLQFNSDEYTDYKNTIVDLAYNGEYSVYNTPQQILDDIIYKISSTKSQDESFFWSDMLPSGAPVSVKTYNFVGSASGTVLPLTRTYNFQSANYWGLLIYQTVIVNDQQQTTQLVKGVDYTVSTTEPSVTITKSITAGSTITVNEYNQTWGSYCPNTPTKLGLYSSTRPGVILDNTYMTPQYFIVGHDGSQTKLWGDYIDGVLTDFRDIALLEFETRVYNNLKVTGAIPLTAEDIIPGAWRTGNYTWDQILDTYSRYYLSWCGQNRINYRDQYYQKNNPYTYNYNQSSDVVTDSTLKQGYWRGIYRWFYDTDNPASQPWRMIGYTDQPSWWTSRYGPAPYTSGNTMMWQDLAEGIDWNDGQPRILPRYVRNGGKPIASIRGTIVGTTLTVTGTLSGSLVAGSYLYGGGVIPGTRIVSLNWSNNGISEWNVDKLQSVYSVVMEVRPQLNLLAVLPVDSSGNLVPPLTNIVDNYNSATFRRHWMPGDGAPQESAYLKSSTWPFDLMKLLSAFQPAYFYNYMVDRDLYKYDPQFNQWLYNGRYHIDPKALTIYGNGTAKHSYINWVVDWINQTGTDGYTTVIDTLKNLDVRLTYRLAGFSDKEYLNFLTENSTPSATTSNLLIPDDSWELLLYEDVPQDRLTYSSVIVQRTESGWTVWGNSGTVSYFTTVTPQPGPPLKIVVGSLTVELSSEFDAARDIVVAYGTEFYTIQGVCEFLLNWGRHLVERGLVYGSVEDERSVNWVTMVQEFMAWAQQGWEIGSTIALNPSALEFVVERENLIVQPLTLQQRNFVLNQNLIPLNDRAIGVIRTGNQFRVKILTEGDTVAYANLNLSAIEHAIVFDNTTIFGDRVYNVDTGLRMSRLLMRGSKTAVWRGWVDANGFILNSRDIVQWSPGKKWAKGNVVIYKNQYWVAQSLIEASDVFNYSLWVATDYNRIKAGLLPNPSTIAWESTLLYDRNQANLDQQEDLLAFALIGFKPRTYMSAAELSDITQVNLYTNLIRSKGTNRSANALRGTTTIAGELDYTVRENWAIKRGDFGAVTNNNALEFLLDDSTLTGNPALIGFSNSGAVANTQQTVTPNNWINWVKEPTSSNFLPATTTPYYQRSGLPTAGYVNIEDAKYNGFALDDLNLTIDSIYGLYRGTVAWLAKFEGDWQVFTPISLGVTLTDVINNLNGTVTMLWSGAHGLTQYAPLLVIAFNNAIDGYYTVTEIVSDTSFIVNNNLAANTLRLTGQGVGMRLRSARAAQASDFAEQSAIIPYNQFATRLNWADQDTNGNWTVWAAGPVYKQSATPTPQMADYPNWGTAAAYSTAIGWVISDQSGGLGRLWRNGSLITPIAPDTKIDDQLTSGDITTYPTSSTGWIATIGTTVLSYTGISLPVGFIVGNFLTTTAGASLFQTGTRIVEIDSINKLVRINLTLLRDVTLADGTAIQVLAQGGVGTYRVTVSQLVASTAVSNPLVTTVFTASIGSVPSPSTIMSVTAVSSGILVSGLELIGTPTIAGTGATQLIAAGSTLFSSDPAGGRVFVYDCSTEAEVLSQTITVVNTGQIAVSDDLLWLYVANTVANTLRVYLRIAGSYTLAEIITGPVGVDWGLSLSISPLDGAKVVVGAPLSTVNSETTAGSVYVYARASEQFVQISPATTVFTTTQTVPGNIAAVYINNVLQTTGYGILGTAITFATPPDDGTIIRVDYAALNLQQILTSPSPLTAAELGTSVTTNRWGAEIFAGAPWDRTTVEGTPNVEGAVYRWTNSGQRWGKVTATIAIGNTSTGTLFINGFKVLYDCTTSIPALVALGLDTPRNRVAYQINTALSGNRIPGIADISYQATTILNIIPLTGSTPIPYDKIDVVGLSSSDLTNIGITPYANTQTIRDLNLQSTSQFGYRVLMNHDTVRDSLLVTAPVISQLAETTWDYTDDLIANDTVFDSGGTTWVDSFVNTGMIYQYDYLPSALETETNPGKYAFGQYINSTSSLANRELGYSSRWGSTMAFADGVAVVGSPTWTSTSGRIEVYTATGQTSSWYKYRVPLTAVDINALNTINIYNTVNNETLEYLEYIDPVQGKLLSPVETNVDWISSVDPADYGEGTTWGPRQIGKIWLNTDNLRMMNCNQPDPQYNAQWWGRAFPGSLVDIYTWIQSPVLPVNYGGPGFPVNFDAWVAGAVLDRSTNTAVPYYYFWVKNYPIIPDGKSLSPNVLSRYILDPQSSGIPFLAPITTNIVALYNSATAINTDGSALHLGYGVANSNDRAHQDWLLIQTNNPDSFLPGVPSTLAGTPTGLYMKYLNSFMGKDLLGQSVPDTSLPLLVRTGTEDQPRQSMFVNRQLALKNYIERANSVLIKIPVLEYKGTWCLTRSGTGWSTTNWWSTVDWWAIGWSKDTKVVIEVEYYSQLLTIGTTDVLNSTSTGIILGLTDGMVARVTSGARGWEVYVWRSTSGWVRIGAQNATVQISSTLYTTTTSPYREIYWIIRWLTEEVYIGDLKSENNSSLITMFEFIQSDSYQEQNYLPWLNKTSLVDVQNTVGKLLPYKKFQRQNIEFVSGYLNEIKPYHVYIKEFSFTYTGIEYWEGDVTDFDLPSKYNTALQKFISPVIVYGNTTPSTGEYKPNNVVWRESDYTNWFNNYGLSFSNGAAPVIVVTTLINDLSISATTISVASTGVLPWSGTIGIGTEILTYKGVDRLNNLLLNIVRGVDSGPANWPAESPVRLYTRPVMVMDPARGYTAAPTVTATVVGSEWNSGSVIYPRTVATFVPVLNNEQVVDVIVQNPGSGYPSTPQLTITGSSIVSDISPLQVDTVLNQITITDHNFQSGDPVMVSGIANSQFGLKVNQYYWVGVINSNTIALYDNYRDSMLGFTTTVPEIVFGSNWPSGGPYTTTTFQLNYPSGYSLDTALFQTGNRVKVRFNYMISPVVYSEQFTYYWIRVLDPALDPNTTTATDSIFDTVAFYTSYSDAMTDVNRVIINQINSGGNAVANNFGLINAEPRTDDYRVRLIVQSGATISVTARILAYTDSSLVRSITPILGFDRVRYTSAAQQWQSGVIYTPGDLVYNTGTVYRCVESYNPTTVTTFSLQYWIAVDSDDPDITATERIVGFYKPTSTMMGFTLSDLSQLMIGTTYPNRTIIDPPFDWGTTYLFLPEDVDTANNTVTLSTQQSLISTYSEVIDGTWGGGVIAANTLSITSTPVIVQTWSANNRLYVTDVSQLSANSAVQFLGNSINSNITAGTTYWISNVDSVTSTITVRDYANAPVVMSNSNGYMTVYNWNSVIANSVSGNAVNLVNYNMALITANANVPVRFTGSATIGNITIDGYYFVGNVTGNTITLQNINTGATQSLSPAVGQMSAVFEPNAYVTATTSGVNLVTLSTLATPYGNVNANSRIRFVGTVFGNIVQNTDYWITTVNSGNNTVSLADAPGGNIISLSTAAGNMTAVFTTYPIRSNTVYTNGDMVRIVSITPSPTTSDYYFINTVAPNQITLHSTALDATTGANAVPVSHGLLGQLARPQSMLSIGGPISANVGDIFPVRYDNNSPTPEFGLTQWGTYWANVITTSTVALYNDRVNAEQDIGRIPLLAGVIGQLTVPQPIIIGNTVVGYQNLASIIIDDSREDTTWEMVGEPFESGYGPEELVPGVTVDGVNFTVTTRPGSTWDPYVQAEGVIPYSTVLNGVRNVSSIPPRYASSGFNRVIITGVTGTVTTQSGLQLNDSVSFENVVASPATVEIYLGLSADVHKIKPNYYTVDWINGVVSITPAQLVAINTQYGTSYNALTQVTIAIYEYGNGSQLARNDTRLTPFRKVQTGPATYRSEIHLGVPYSMIEQPSEDNFWLSTTVFVNGIKLEYNDPNQTFYNSSVDLYTLEPVRRYDPVNDPYNPAKIVFNSDWSGSTNYCAWAVTSNVLGFYVVTGDDLTTTIAENGDPVVFYTVPITAPIKEVGDPDGSFYYETNLIRVWQNGILRDGSVPGYPKNWTITPTNDTTVGGFVTIIFNQGELSIGDVIKITYSSGGISIPTTQWLTPTTNGTNDFTIENFMGDTNYAPLVDLRVLGINGAPSFANTFGCTTTVQLRDGDRIYITGNDTNNIFNPADYNYNSVTNPTPYTFYLKNVQYDDSNLQWTFLLTRYVGAPSSAAVPLQTVGATTGLTFSLVDNLVVEVNGVRYTGISSTEVNYEVVNQYTTYLSYPAPVFSLNNFEPTFLDVRINGISQPYGPTGVWRVNFDEDTDTFNSFDADYGFPNNAANPMLGFFDDGTPFDNQSSLNVVFEYENGGVPVLNQGDIITIEYVVTGTSWTSGVSYVEGDIVVENDVTYRCTTANTASPANQPPNAGFWETVPVNIPVYSVVVNQDLVSPDIDEQLIGGELTLRIPDLTTTDIVSVTSWGRTAQQSLEFQGMTDITVTQIVAISNNNGVLPLRVNTGTQTHNLLSGDMVMINGSALGTIDGTHKAYWVNVINSYTVELYQDYAQTVPLTYTGTLNLLAQSYIQCVYKEASRGTLSPIASTVINQPLFNLANIDRLLVNYSQSGNNRKIGVTRYWIDREFLRIVSLTDEYGVTHNVLLILQPVRPEAIIGVTSMVPSASPAENKLRINAQWNTLTGQPVTAYDFKTTPNRTVYYTSIYRENQYTQTYVKSITYSTDVAIIDDQTANMIDTITVDNPLALIDILTFTGVSALPVAGSSGQYTSVIYGVKAGEIADLRIINSFNNPVIDYYWIFLSSNSIRIVYIADPDPTVAVKVLTVKIAIGNEMIINGELIKYGQIDFTLNSATYGRVSKLQHNRNTTFLASIQPYAIVQSVISTNLMQSGLYDVDWYSNIIKYPVATVNNISGTYTFAAGEWSQFSQISPGSGISFANASISTGNLVVATGTSNGVLNFRVAAFDSNNYSLLNSVNTVNTNILLNSVTGISTGMSVICSDYPTAFSGATVTGIAGNIITVSSASTVAIPPGVQLQIANTLPNIYPNVKLITEGDFIGVNTNSNSGWVPITYTKPGALVSANVFRVLSSSANTSNSSFWTITIAEPITVIPSDVATANITEFTVANVSINSLTDITTITINPLILANVGPIGGGYPNAVIDTIATIVYPTMDLPLQIDTSYTANFLKRETK